MNQPQQTDPPSNHHSAYFEYLRSQVVIADEKLEKAIRENGELHTKIYKLHQDLQEARDNRAITRLNKNEKSILDNMRAECQMLRQELNKERQKNTNIHGYKLMQENQRLEDEIKKMKDKIDELQLIIKKQQSIILPTGLNK